MEEEVESRKRGGRRKGKERDEDVDEERQSWQQSSRAEETRQAFQIWPRTHSPIFFHLKNPDLSKM